VKDCHTHVCRWLGWAVVDSFLMVAHFACSNDRLFPVLWLVVTAVTVEVDALLVTREHLLDALHLAYPVTPRFNG
jgi:hypothetical protein